MVSDLCTIALLGGTKVLLPGHDGALALAQWCPSLGALQTWRNKEYLLGILFSYFLMIENVCSGFYLKIEVVDFRKIFIAGFF